MFFVRTAMEADIPAVCSLLAETWHVTYDEILGPEKVETIVNSWLSPEAMLRRLRRPHGEFLVADFYCRRNSRAGSGSSAAIAGAAGTNTKHEAASDCAPPPVRKS